MLVSESCIFDEYRKLVCATYSGAELVEYLYNQCPVFWGQITQEEAKEILEGESYHPVHFLIREKDLTQEKNNLKFEIIIKIGGEYLNRSMRSISPHHAYGVYQNDQLTWNLIPSRGVRRTRPFSLKELCRAKILGSGINEDVITQLEIPLSLKKYLKE